MNHLIIDTTFNVYTDATGGAGAQADPNAGAGNSQPKDDGGVTDVDFEEVK